MKTLLVLVLLAALAAGGYYSKPNQEAHKANADKFLADQRSRDGDDIGDLIGGVLESANRKDSFEDLLVATKYTAKSGDKTLVECWGVFAQFLCNAPGEKKAG